MKPYLLAGVLLASCRSVQTKSFTVETNPPGSVVKIEGLYKGTGPCEVSYSYDRRRGSKVTVEALPPKEGADNRLYTQSQVVDLSALPASGGIIYLDLRLEATLPTQPFEVRRR